MHPYLGAHPMGSTPAQLAAYIRAEIAKWPKVIREANTRSERPVAGALATALP